MRLLACYACNTLNQLPDFDGDNPDRDTELAAMVRKHEHGLDTQSLPGSTARAHPGGQLFTLQTQYRHVQGVPMLGGHADQPIDLSRQIEAIRTELQGRGVGIANQAWELRDEVKDDALKCFAAHHNPEWPGKPCRDYKSDAKRLSSKKMRDPAGHVFVCQMCPYEETVRIEKRRKAGQYK